MPQRASVFCNFYIRVDREALVSERALDVGSVAFKAMSTKNSISILLLLLELNKVCKNVFTKLLRCTSIVIGGCAQKFTLWFILMNFFVKNKNVF
jgi:hypothetical protein